MLLELRDKIQKKFYVAATCCSSFQVNSGRSGRSSFNSQLSKREKFSVSRNIKLLLPEQSQLIQAKSAAFKHRFNAPWKYFNCNPYITSIGTIEPKRHKSALYGRWRTCVFRRRIKCKWTVQGNPNLNELRAPACLIFVWLHFYITLLQFFANHQHHFCVFFWVSEITKSSLKAFDN